MTEEQKDRIPKINNSMNIEPNLDHQTFDKINHIINNESTGDLVN